MRQTILLLVALLAVGTTGCSQKASQASATRPASKATSPGEHDKLWAAKAYQFNLYQIEVGKVAAARAKSDRVRNLARMMVRDYSELGGELETFAREHQLPLPGEMDEQHADLLRQLADVPNGEDFDQSYLNLELRAHHRLVAAYEEEAKQGEYPAARAVAEGNLPELYARLQHVRLLRQGMWSGPAKP